jgi:phosphoribosylaminoimidazole-succinocarboxamide synthase
VKNNRVTNEVLPRTEMATMNLLETNLGAGTLAKRQGKVRDIYDLGEKLLLVATDRISAFDWVLPSAIPDKGRVLTSLSVYWFNLLQIPNHLITTDVEAAGLSLAQDEREALRGRSMLVRKARVVPFECVVRGYLSGSAWKEYRANGSVCGIRLPSGLVESQAIEPIFTPATKAQTGHDENVSFDLMSQSVGEEVAKTLQSMSLEAYRIAAIQADTRGLILADTKFEWGFDDATGELLLVDEVLTPDSSRYWSKQLYRPGGPQPSFDKQFVRDWLETTTWDKTSPPPQLPEDVVAKTREKYIEAYERLTATTFPWK